MGKEKKVKRKGDRERRRRGEEIIGRKMKNTRECGGMGDREMSPQ